MAMQNGLVVQQTTITLPYLEVEVPALYLADVRPYIPVFAVCQILGIRADTHIQRWRHLVFWTTARKLTAVQDVSLEVPDKAVVALLGTNGAGKTTIIRAISGLCSGNGRLEIGTLRQRACDSP